MSTLRTRPSRAGTREPDEACAAGRGPGQVRRRRVAGPETAGEHLGVEAEGDRIVTHLFACLDPPTSGGGGRSPSPGRRGPRRSRSARPCCCPAPSRSSRPTGCPGATGSGPGTSGVGDLLPAQPGRRAAGPGGRCSRATKACWTGTTATAGPGPGCPRWARPTPGHCPRPVADQPRRRDDRPARGVSVRRVLSAIGRDETACAGTPASTARAARWRTRHRGRA